MTAADVVAVAYGAATGLVLLDIAADLVAAWLGVLVPAGVSFAGCVVGVAASVVAVVIAPAVWAMFFAAVGCAAGLFAWAHRPTTLGGSQ